MIISLNNTAKIKRQLPHKYHHSGKMMDRESLAEWAKDKPLSILQLDPPDRAVLRIAGKTIFFFLINYIYKTELKKMYIFLTIYMTEDK